MLKLINWFKTLCSGDPHFRIGDQADPYLLRWYVIPRNRFINLYLHKFLRDDEDRALHDHPWWFLSLMIWGRYDEHLPGGRVVERATPSLAFRKAEHQHRVVLRKDAATGKPVPCWTLIITGPKQREWGFWCPKGFVVWTDFVDRTNHGSTGRGCE